MRQIFKLLIAALYLCSSVVLAQVTEATLTAEGSGMSRDEAVAAALSNAAGQAFGIQLDAHSITSSTSAESVTNQESEHSLLSVVNRSVVQAINSPVNSPILGYEIESISQGIADSWDATVTLRYAKFERLGADTDRRSMVVVSNEKRYRNLLIQNVSETLVATRRFDVLNRENDSLFQSEKDFILGEDSAVEELSRLSQASGADYLVLAELQNLGVSNNMRETIALTGEVLVRSAVSGTLRLQVIEFASRKLKWSGSKKFGATYEGVSSIGQATIARHLNNSAKELVDQMVAAIYPIRIVKVMGDIAIINRGEGSTKENETYEVFLLGEEIIDPQSGESLGSLELEIGLGRITEVKPKFSLLKMANGPLDQNSEYIVRKTNKKINTKPAKPRQAARKPAAAKPKEPSRKDMFLNN